MLEKLKGIRKILLGVLVIAIGVALELLTKVGLSNNMLNLLEYVGVGFFLGNGIEHVAQAFGSSGPTAVPGAVQQVMDNVAPQVAELKGAVSALQEQNQVMINSVSGVQKGIGALLQLAGK